MVKEPSARDQLLIDIFTTGMEGGISYWSQCEQYHWSDGKSDDQHEDYLGFYADIIDVENDDKPYHIDRGVIIKGYNLAAGEWRSKVSWSTEPPPLVITSDTDWDYDAGDADMIVQLGLFGSVIYG